MAALDGVDAMVVPTAPMHPRIDEVAADPVGVNSRLGTYTNFCNLFDLCAVAVPAGTAGQAQFGITVLARAFEDAVAVDIAALASGAQAPVDVWPLAVADSVELVVFGAHLRGGPLSHQLTDQGARWAGEVTTAPRYRMSVLPTVPAKPAITRVPDGAPGAKLSGHRWLLSPAALGRFLAALAGADAARQGRIRRRDMANRVRLRRRRGDRHRYQRVRQLAGGHRSRRGGVSPNGVSRRAISASMAL